MPDINLGADTVLCRGEQLLLAPYSEGAYQWFDGTSDSVKAVTQPGSYWIEVLYSGEVKDTIQVDFIDCPGFIPNAFSPNGDAYKPAI